MPGAGINWMGGTKNTAKKKAGNPQKRAQNEYFARTRQYASLGITRPSPSDFTLAHAQKDLQQRVVQAKANSAAGSKRKWDQGIESDQDDDDDDDGEIRGKRKCEDVGRNGRTSNSKILAMLDRNDPDIIEDRRKQLLAMPDWVSLRKPLTTPTNQPNFAKGQPRPSSPAYPHDCQPTAGDYRNYTFPIQDSSPTHSRPPSIEPLSHHLVTQNQSTVDPRRTLTLFHPAPRHPDIPQSSATPIPVIPGSDEILSVSSFDPRLPPRDYHFRPRGPRCFTPIHSDAAESLRKVASDSWVRHFSRESRSKEGDTEFSRPSFVPLLKPLSKLQYPEMHRPVPLPKISSPDAGNQYSGFSGQGWEQAEVLERKTLRGNHKASDYEDDDDDPILEFDDCESPLASNPDRPASSQGEEPTLSVPLLPPRQCSPSAEPKWKVESKCRSLDTEYASGYGQDRSGIEVDVRSGSNREGPNIDNWRSSAIRELGLDAALASNPDEPRRLCYRGPWMDGGVREPWTSSLVSPKDPKESLDENVKESLDENVGLDWRMGGDVGRSYHVFRITKLPTHSEFGPETTLDDTRHGDDEVGESQREGSQIPFPAEDKEKMQPADLVELPSPDAQRDVTLESDGLRPSEEGSEISDKENKPPVAQLTSHVSKQTKQRDPFEDSDEEETFPHMPDTLLTDGGVRSPSFEVSEPVLLVPTQTSVPRPSASFGILEGLAGTEQRSVPSPRDPGSHKAIRPVFFYCNEGDWLNDEEN